jgi:hypothetical protein
VGFEFFQEHPLVSHPEYSSVLHELRDEHDNQMLVIHMDVHKFSPSVLKRMMREFKVLRSCTNTPIFAFEPSPDDKKWEHYVELMGFSYLMIDKCSDSLSRRCFVSYA